MVGIICHRYGLSIIYIGDDDDDDDDGGEGLPLAHFFKYLDHRFNSLLHLTIPHA